MRVKPAWNSIFFFTTDLRAQLFPPVCFPPVPDRGFGDCRYLGCPADIALEQESYRYLNPFLDTVLATCEIKGAESVAVGRQDIFLIHLLLQ